MPTEGTAFADAKVVIFSSAVFDIEVIKRAAYRFLNAFVADIRVAGDEIVCSLTVLEGVDKSLPTLIEEFRAEVLDQDLRKAVAKETADLRRAILALAFSPSNLVGRE